MAIRVLVVDDSAFMRKVIGEAVTSQHDLQLAGTAINGLDALLKIEQLKPDVVTLDVEMPEMDGLTALRHLMARYPRPVVMVSSVTHDGAQATMRALAMGAVDFVGKPSGAISLDFQRVREELLHKIRIAATARVVGGRGSGDGRQGFAAPQVVRPVSVARRDTTPTGPRPPTPGPRHLDPRPLAPGPHFDRLVVIGSSTGGPRALSAVLAGLPDDGRTAYAIVQHMPAGFTHSLAQRLDGLSPLTIREARHGDHLAPGTALVAPGDHHFRVTPNGTVELNQAERVHGVRPSVDVALDSVAEHFGALTVAAILTGMGSDGAAGAQSIHAAGGRVLAEHESTCVVYGMPRAVIERGVADRVVPLDDMAEAIVDAVGTRRIARSGVRSGVPVRS